MQECAAPAPANEHGDSFWPSLRVKETEAVRHCARRRAPNNAPPLPRAAPRPPTPPISPTPQRCTTSAGIRGCPPRTRPRPCSLPPPAPTRSTSGRRWTAPSGAPTGRSTTRTRSSRRCRRASARTGRPSSLGTTRRVQQTHQQHAHLKKRKALEPSPAPPCAHDTGDL